MATYHSLRDMERMAIDEKLADGNVRSDEAIRILKAQRNELAPIAVLPDDILVEIFFLQKEMYVPQSAKWHWQHVAHTCSYWRRVAIGSPALWSEVLCNSYPFTLLMLERSRNAPLHLYYWPSYATPILAAVMDQIERIQTITLHSPKQEVLAEIRDIIGERRALALQGVSINLDSIDWLGHKWGSTDRMLFEIFRPSPKVFRKLGISGGTYDWTVLSTMPNLTHLDLAYTSSVTDSYTGAEFIAALRCFTHLEELRITGDSICQLEDFPPTPPPPPVHFSRLRVLLVDEACQAHVDGLLALAVLPALRKAYFGDTTKIANPQSHIQSVASLVHTGDFPRLEFLHIQCGPDAITMTISPIYWDRSYEPGIHLRFYPQHLIATREAASRESASTQSACTAVQIMSWIKPYIQTNKIVVRYLRLEDGTGTLTTPDFVREFGHLLHLESIDTGYREAMVLFDTLASSAVEAASTDSDTQILFPKLSSIILRRDDSLEARELPFGCDNFTTAWNCLAARRQRGAPIKKLDLVGYAVLDDHQSLSLAELGVEVNYLGDEFLRK